MSRNQIKMDSPTLIYTYDPLCGWCYAFHPVIKKLADRFERNLNIRVMPGGLATGENVQTISEGYAHIPATINQIEKNTGAVFGENFRLLAEEGSYIFNSVPSCKAQTVINTLHPGLALDFAGAMQSALFRDGKSLNEPGIFADLLTQLNPDADLAEFSDQYNSSETEKQTLEQFEWCKASDASAFPTLLLEIGSETGLMSKGYRPYDTLESHLHHLIRNIERLSS